MQAKEKKENPVVVRWQYIRLIAFFGASWGGVQTLGFIGAAYSLTTVGVVLILLPAIIVILVNGEVDANRIFFAGHRSSAALMRAKLPAYGILTLMAAAIITGAYAAVGMTAIATVAVVGLIILIIFAGKATK